MKKRKFADGGMSDYGEDESGQGGAGTTLTSTPESAPEAPQTFKEAFRDARKSGAKSFTFNGKKYTTDVASSKSKDPTAGEAKDKASQLAADRTDSVPTKRPGIMQSMRDKDKVLAAMIMRNRQSTPSLGTGATPGPTATANPMSPAYGQGRVDPNTQLPNPGMKKGGKVKKMASGGSVKGGGCEAKGLRKAKMY